MASIALITGRGEGWIDEDHDRKLEPLRSMHGHHPNALGALFDDGRLLGLTCFCVSFYPFYEGTKRGRTALLEPARQVDHPQAVGERLLASSPHRNARVRPDSVQQPQYRLGNWTAVAPDMEATQQSKRIGGFRFLCSGLELRALNRRPRGRPPQPSMPYGADLAMPRVGDDPVTQCARRRPHDRSFAPNARSPSFAPNRISVKWNRRRRPAGGATVSSASGSPMDKEEREGGSV